MRAVFFVVLLLPFMILGLVDDAFAGKGDITAVRAQSLGNVFEIDGGKATANSLVKVDSDTYALAYTGADNDGFISTFTIDSYGNITAVKTQSDGNNLEHNTDYAHQNSLVQVDSDTYALAYRGTDSDGFISTFTISSDGTTTVSYTHLTLPTICSV